MYNTLRSSRNPSAQLFVFIRYKEGELLHLRVSSKYSSDLCVDLLLLSNGQTHHYVLITDLMWVVEYVRGTLHRDRNQICRKCFHTCSSIDTLQRHQEMCYQDEGVVITMPKPGKDTHRFKNLSARLYVPRVIYFDLESLLLPVYGPQPDPKKSSTQTLEIHQPCGYALVVVEFGKREFLKFELKRGENVIKELIASLESLADNLLTMTKLYLITVTIPTSSWGRRKTNAISIEKRRSIYP